MIFKILTGSSISAQGNQELSAAGTNIKMEADTLNKNVFSVKKAVQTKTD